MNMNNGIIKYNDLNHEFLKEQLREVDDHYHELLVKHLDNLQLYNLNIIKSESFKYFITHSYHDHDLIEIQELNSELIH
jgi:hypothetical protein